MVTDEAVPAPHPDDPVWEAALVRALRGEGVRLAAQPIVSTAAATVVGYELLARFDGPFHAGPDLWFAAARRRDLDAALTAVVLDLAHATRAAYAPQRGFCTVNLDPHLLGSRGVLDALFAAGRLDGLVVELTEHAVAEDDEVLADALARIREEGGLVAMDDAGTGHSGIHQLLRIRPDFVKLDRSLVRGVHQDPVQRAAVRMIGELAGQLDAWLLAEGVETLAELGELIRLGVPLVQGYALGRPHDEWRGMPEQVASFVRSASEGASVGEHVVSMVRPTPLVTQDAVDVRSVAEGTVLLDERGRAVSVLVLDPAGRPHAVPALLVSPTSSPLDVLRRAMSRPAPCRAAPVVCTDARGAVLGTIDLADLVSHISAAPADVGVEIPTPRGQPVPSYERTTR